jgi:hypothetical protein
MKRREGDPNPAPVVEKPLLSSKIITLKPIRWILFFLLQAVFIASGLALVFWTVNTWDSDRRLDAIFGAGLGAYAFLFAWKVIQRWARQNL